MILVTPLSIYHSAAYCNTCGGHVSPLDYMYHCKGGKKLEHYDPRLRPNDDPWPNDFDYCQKCARKSKKHRKRNEQKKIGLKRGQSKCCWN